MSVSPAQPFAETPLHGLPRGATARIGRLAAPRDQAERELLLRLIEIGFLPGERVRVVAKGRAGSEPIAVRLSEQSTFALRRREAALIEVLPEDNGGAGA